MSKMYYYDNRTLKEKVTDFTYDVKKKANETMNWVKEHPGETITIIGATVGAAAEVRRIGDRLSKMHANKIARTSMYCNDVQGRVRIKHELSRAENLRLRDLMSNGYTRLEALDEMNLLK